MSNTNLTSQTQINTILPLSSEERNKILYEFNKTNWAFKKEQTLVSLFLKQVSLHPDNVAAVYQDQHITYRELDEKSNQIANTLIAKGITEGMYIPVWLDRSLEWVIAILGILKTGATYVPIDPAYPVRRVEYILNDTKAEIIITNQVLSQNLSKDSNLHIFYLDRKDDLTDSSVQHPEVIIHHNTLAYTIYTSGSTGNPKGVMITHESIQHLVTWHNVYFNVTPTSHLSLVAGLAFDISVWETWSALTSGATLFIADSEERTEASALVSFYQKNKITHGFAPTVLVPAVVAHTRNHNDLQLEYLFTGGEKLKPVLTDD